MRQHMSRTLSAGAAVADITPKTPQFLYGYPHVERESTGVHDRLMASALFLSDGSTEAIFIANDIIFVPRSMAMRARQRISHATSTPAANIMITATHTHSGPLTSKHISNEADPVVPEPDPAYLRLMEDAIVECAVKARRSARRAEAGLALAHAAGIGTNRRDPSGPADPQTPILLVRSPGGHSNIAAMLVCSMHPTVLHEDSKLISGDFVAMARTYLQENVLGRECPVLHHTGPSGNQSPRHVTRENTFAEAERLGNLLGQAVEKAVHGISFTPDVKIECLSDSVDLSRRHFPSVGEAEAKLARATARLEELRRNGSPSQEVRTAECDWFGAEETLTLARAEAEGRLDAVYAACLPVEVQIIKVGPWTFAGWPGECFVDYALDVKAHAQDTFVISLANGELQGYIVTPEAAAEGGYEASNALFGPESGKILVHKTLRMLQSEGSG